MRATFVWLLAGVLAGLGSQPGVAGTGNHLQENHQDRQGGPTLAVERYVAIGDSYTSGAGIAPVDWDGCYRSTRNYPNLVADRLGARLVDASCGGAYTAHTSAAQVTGDGTNPPQASALGQATDVVTVSLGINDAGYGVILGRCLQVAARDPEGSPCRDSFRSPAGDQLLAGLPAVKQHVRQVLEQVQQAAPDATVVVVGYPQLAPEHGTCPELQFARGDYAYLAEFVAAVDHVLADAADATGTRYVDLLTPSKGHDICAGDDAWVVGAQTDEPAMSWHPYPVEHRAVAALVLDSVQHPTR